MANTPTTPPTALDTAFVANRQQFWNQFTGFTKWAVIALIALLAVLYIFVV